MGLAHSAQRSLSAARRWLEVDPEGLGAAKARAVPPQSPTQSHRKDSRGQPEHRGHPSAPAPTPQPRAAAAKTLCPELLWPIATNLGAVTVERGASPKSFPQNTLRYCFSLTEVQFLKEIKALGVQQTGTHGAGGGRSPSSAPLGIHLPYCPPPSTCSVGIR